MNKKTLKSQDFKGKEIQEGMRITLGDNNKIKKKDGLVIDKGEIKIIGPKFKFLEGDILIITKTQEVEIAGTDKLRKEITLIVERDGKILENKGDQIKFIFSGRVLIHSFFPKGVSNLSEVLIDAREKAKGDVGNILELKKR